MTSPTQKGLAKIHGWGKWHKNDVSGGLVYHTQSAHYYVSPKLNWITGRRAGSKAFTVSIMHQPYGSVTFSELGEYPNLKAAKAAVLKAVRARKQAAPPGISKWNMFDGGRMVRGPGRHSYSYRAGTLTYSIGPAWRDSGRFAGYILTVSPGARGMHAWVASNGNEFSYPVESYYRRPADAALAARKHFAKGHRG